MPIPSPIQIIRFRIKEAGIKLKNSIGHLKMPYAIHR